MTIEEFTSKQIQPDLPNKPLKLGLYCITAVENMSWDQEVMG